MNWLSKLRWAAVVLFLFLLSSALLADVTKESETKMQFKGTLGTMMKLFGGGKPSRSVEYLKGDVYRKDELDKKGRPRRTQLIDLNQEKFVFIDHKKKKYSEMTFDEWRTMIEENMRKFQEAASSQPESEGNREQAEPEVKWSFDVSVETPGETQRISGYDTREVVVKLKVEAEAEAEQQASEEAQGQKEKGGLIVTSKNWMAESIPPAEELTAFHQRLAKKLGLDPRKGDLGNFISRIMKSNPELAAAIERVKEESKKLQGVPMSVETRFETYGESKQQAQAEEEKVPKSFGGLLKGFAKKKAKKKDKDSNVLLTTYTQVTKFDSSPLSDDLFVIPAKYKKEAKK